MYCSRCSAQISEDLNFCSTCGERVNKNELAGTSKKQSEMLDNLAVTAIFIGVGGMLFLVGLVAVLLDKSIPAQLVVALAAMYLAAWFGILYKLLAQISKIVDANIEQKKAPPAPPSSSPLELPAKVTAQLEAERSAPASVTEDTTHSLDPVPVRRR
jgi:predicted nucleic acid-binding Zn ribbon protein